MTITRQFLVTASFGLLALMVVAGIMAAVAAIDSSLNSNSLLKPGSAAWVTFAYTNILGLLPVLTVGAPGYVLLLRKNLANWYNVLALGIAPGVIAVLFDANLALWAIICGAIVSIATHLAYRKFGPNNSFKPTPLRGAA